MRRMQNINSSQTNIIVGSLLMSALFLVVYGTLHCPVFVSHNYHMMVNLTLLNDLTFEEKIKAHREYNLNRGGTSIYLDYASEILYPNSIIDEMFNEFRQGLYGNTHSESPSADKSTDAVEDLRSDILQYFSTTGGQYVVIFTSSNGQALKTLVESIPFNKTDSEFAFSTSSNNDILGLRNYAVEKGATPSPFDITNLESTIPKFAKNNIHFVGLPLVDLFNGEMVTKDQMKKIIALNDTKDDTYIITTADASHFLSFNRLNLTETPFSAVSFSIDHIFGYPKLGVLLIEKDLVNLLKKPYFGGGTLVYALPSADVVKMRLRPSERYEDGSLPFLDIVTTRSTFNIFKQLGIQNISKKVAELTKELYKSINNLTYPDTGKKATVIYGDNPESIVSFNFLDKKGIILPYEKYFRRLMDANIHVSAGCHRTPGSCFKALGVDEKYLEDNIETVNISSYGSIRVSVGWATTTDDIFALRSVLNDMIKLL